MQRISTLLQKLTELADNRSNLTAIDVDLMMDYTRVLYADLIELKKDLPSTIDKTPVIPAVTATPQPATEDKPTEVQAENQPVIPKYADVPAHDMRTVIGINDKYLFISELFGDDKTAYDDAIKQLNQFTTSDEAVNWTEKNLENKYNWDKESETTQSFYSLLNKCFSSI